MDNVTASRTFCYLLASITLASGISDVSAQTPVRDPLVAQVDLTDAYRFARVFQDTNGQPSKDALQAGYLKGAGRGVEIFTRGRIESAENLAKTVADRSTEYAKAIEICLPSVEASNADLRAIYLGLSGLFPDRELPRIYAVFGAFNSGGTASRDAQVIGIEVICNISEGPEQIRETLRSFYAHETVHALQPSLDRRVEARDPLLAYSLREGMADFVSLLVTGSQPSPERHAWAKEREAQLWAEFLADRAYIQSQVTKPADLNRMESEALKRLGRWHGNYQSAPEGWPHELGYWFGQQICQAYFDQAEDKRAAIAELMALKDPERILELSGYSPAQDTAN
jgi:hypothetical protein